MTIIPFNINDTVVTISGLEGIITEVLPEHICISSPAVGLRKQDMVTYMILKSQIAKHNGEKILMENNVNAISCKDI